MGVSKKVLMVGGVTVATMGLSNCSDGGAVVPAPPPLDCGAVGGGQDLDVLSATVSGTTLVVELLSSSYARWSGAPAVTGVTGGTLGGVALEDGDYGPATIRIELTAPDAASGTFTLEGTLADDETQCAVQRTFAFTVDAGAVEVALQGAPQPRATLASLPRSLGERSSIVLARRQGRDVELRAASGTAGVEVRWAVTGGEIVPAARDSVIWRLPSAPGLYHVEMLVDRGRSGLTIDTLTLEVT